VKKKSYTVLIVPEGSAKVRRYKVFEKRVYQLILGAFAVLSVASFMVVHYFYVLDQASQQRQLQEENVILRAKLHLVQDEVQRIDRTLAKIDHFADRVRNITALHDPERNLAMGPLMPEEAQLRSVLFAEGERIDFADELIDSKLALRLLDSQLETTDEEALRQERKLRELYEYFGDHGTLLSSTPSIRPVRSKLLSSGFGTRTDPYTNQHVMHKGMDYAADHGSEVFAGAKGIVVFVGDRGGYGKTVVVDHGFGFQTHYAHLSKYHVEMGQDVERGQVIARVGNTGRSTGNHLHYEVRFNGVPQDPDQYILN
jgi:murein DD-endopeptidase MepM/ murein hydrolase activator NlpD